MKLTIDTDKFKIPSFSLREYSDREVFFLCVMIILFAYMLSDWLETRKFVSVDARIGRVEATLDRVVENLNEDTLGASRDAPEPDRIVSRPKSKFTALSRSNKKIILNEREYDCLARNIYWESKTEPLVGQIAVAQVTYNRVISRKWGDDFCSVVFAYKQFSWTLFKKIRNATPKSKVQWTRAKHSADLFLNGTRVNNLGTTQFYYAQYIRKPKWANQMVKDDHIGQHIFYSSLE